MLGRSRLSPSLLMLLLIICLLASFSTGEIIKVDMILPFTGWNPEQSSRFEQWRSVARLAADSLNAGWSHSFDLQAYDSKFDGAISVFLSANSAQNGTKAVIGCGIDDFNDDSARLLRNYDQLPLISPDTSVILDDTLPNQVSMTSRQSEVRPVISAMMDYFGWTKVGLIYSIDEESITLSNYMVSNHSNTAKIPITFGSRSYLDDVKQIFKQSINIIVVSVPYASDVQQIIRDSQSINLFSEGKAWIFVNLPSDFDRSLLPVGTFAIDAADATPHNVTDFLNLIESASPTTYPGLGPGCVYQPQSIMVYDSMVVLKSAIDNLGAVPITRSAILNQIRTATFTSGLFGGPVSFDFFSLRTPQTYNIINYRRSGPVLSFVYTHDDSFASSWVEVDTAATFSGGITAVPSSSEKIFPIAIVTWMNPSSTSISPLKKNGTLSLFQYAVEVVNHDYLPPGYKFSVIPFDDEGTPSTAIQISSALPSFGVIGVIGSLTSRVSQAIQDVVTTYNIPQLSTSSSAVSLGVKTNAPTFLRNVPSDNLRAEAFAAICNQWGWTHVGVISTDDTYGSGLAAAFTLIAGDYNVKILKQSVISLATPDYAQAIRDMQDADVRVVLTLASNNDPLIQLKIRAKQLNYKAKAWFGSEAWLKSELETKIKDTILDLSDFDGFVSKNPSGGFGSLHDQMMANLSALDPLDYPGLTANTIASSYVARTFDSILIYANAVSRMIAAGHDPKNPALMLSHLLSTNATFTTGPTNFYENGDRDGSYDISNSINGTLLYRGRWSKRTGALFESAVVWPDGTTQVPLSYPPRERKWISWTSPIGIIFSILAAAGILTAAVFFFFVIQQKNSSVIRTATFEFLLLMLFGCMLGYGSIFTWIGEPHPYVCALRIWLPPIALITIMAPLLAKTWRLHRIFTLSSLKIVAIPLYHLVIITCVLITIQIVICIIWISLGTIKTTVVLDKSNDLVSYVTCAQNTANRVLSYITYGYVGLITIVGAYLAFKVRNLPKDLNESRWIGITIYNTLLWGILIVVLGFSLSQFVNIVLILICIATFFITTGAIGFMLAPKLWNLLQNPEKRSSSGRSGRTDTRATTSKDYSTAQRWGRHDFSKKRSKELSRGLESVPHDDTNPK